MNYVSCQRTSVCVCVMFPQHVSYFVVLESVFFVCVLMCVCVCVSAHLWPQMHVNVTQFLLASSDLSLFPWQQKQAPARQVDRSRQYEVGRRDERRE